MSRLLLKLEKIGFLPGDMKEKVDPYLRPLYDALYELFGVDKIDKKIETGEIERPFGIYERKDSQELLCNIRRSTKRHRNPNKMFLTRIGENSKLVVNGDPSQIDLINTVL